MDSECPVGRVAKKPPTCQVSQLGLAPGRPPWCWDRGPLRQAMGATGFPPRTKNPVWAPASEPCPTAAAWLARDGGGTVSERVHVLSATDVAVAGTPWLAPSHPHPLRPATIKYTLLACATPYKNSVYMKMNSQGRGDGASLHLHPLGSPRVPTQLSHLPTVCLG